MALMSIDINKAYIDLIANIDHISNECKSVYTFDIISTENNTVSMDVSYTAGNYPYDKIEVYDVATSAWVITNTFPVSIKLNAEGKSKARITIGNAAPDSTQMEHICNETELTVTDTTNTASEKYIFDRCYERERC